MIVLEAVLPSPVLALTPSVSRVSQSGGEVTERPAPTDKPPAPFVL